MPAASLAHRGNLSTADLDGGAFADAERPETAAGDPQAPARQRRGSAVVNAILEATRAEIVHVGYFDLRIDEVARVAGVNKTTVYRRWPDRLSLVRDAMVDTIEAVDLPTLTGQVSEDLRRHLYAFCALTDTPLGAAMLAARMQAQENLELIQLMEHLRVVRQDRPRRILQAGIERGELRADLDVELALDMLHGAFKGRLTHGQACLDSDFVERALDLLLRGMVAPPSAGSVAPTPA